MNLSQFFPNLNSQNTGIKARNYCLKIETWGLKDEKKEEGIL